MDREDVVHRHRPLPDRLLVEFIREGGRARQQRVHMEVVDRRALVVIERRRLASFVGRVNIERASLP